ncbi:hypothetical protein [Halobacillus litoralis]|uniref:hypothetical protein n=1 Tax=Halobacillus litoralis TaxID=45668 RepID=UPI0013E8CC70|nr:hypothetical protein [Halobacillus litoralis]
MAHFYYVAKIKQLWYIFYGEKSDTDEEKSGATHSSLHIPGYCLWRNFDASGAWMPAR